MEKETWMLSPFILMNFRVRNELWHSPFFLLFSWRVWNVKISYKSCLLGQLWGTSLSHGHSFSTWKEFMLVFWPCTPHHTHSFDKWWEHALTHLSNDWISSVKKPQALKIHSFLSTHTDGKQQSQIGATARSNLSGVRVGMSARRLPKLWVMFWIHSPVIKLTL